MGNDRFRRICIGLTMWQGYSNVREVHEVIKQARIATDKYGPDAEIKVITFYNMQKRNLEREFKENDDLPQVCIASVRERTSR